VFRVGPCGTGPRVVWADIARRPTAVVLEACGFPTAIPLNTCYSIRTPDRQTALLVAAVLNSTWCAAIARVSADEARGGYRRINVRLASGFPIPAAGPATDDLISLSAQAHERNDPVLDDLDTAVARAYGLSAGTQRVLRALATYRS
jgi:hypothetical protein